MVTWTEVETYCKARLNEIVDINKQHPCPSSFVCVAAFIAYLSRLAYGTSVRLDHHDKDWFEKFVKNFMPARYHSHEDLIYRTFRCGILHSMSFDDEIDDDRAVYLTTCGGRTSGCSKLAITHDTSLSHLCNGNHLVKEPTTNAYVLVADVLCKDIESAITMMFKDADVQKNSEEFVACQRYITGMSIPYPSSLQTGNPIVGGVAGVPLQQTGTPVVAGGVGVSSALAQQTQPQNQVATTKAGILSASN